jgi:hypothetical protein
MTTRGRPSTGNIKWRKNKRTGKPQWHARFTLPNGTRTPYEPLDSRILREDVEGARAAATLVNNRVRETGLVPQSVPETVEEYADRWCKWRESRGVAGNRTLLAMHVFPQIGSLDVCKVTRDDLKGLVAMLDAKVKRGQSLDPKGKRHPFGWKTAVNAWAATKALFRDARGAKRVDLCVRDDNPAEGVAGPDVGAKKAKVYLWPSEFNALVNCPRVPVRRRG